MIEHSNDPHDPNASNISQLLSNWQGGLLDIVVQQNKGECLQRVINFGVLILL